MTALDEGDRALLFVSNVLNGTVAADGAVVHRGTVLRIALSVRGDGDGDSDDRVVETSRTTIGEGFGERADPAALVVGPTGVGLGRDGTLYVADSVGNRIVAIADAATRSSCCTEASTWLQRNAASAGSPRALRPSAYLPSTTSIPERTKPS